jgi:hypothetical protein
MSTKRKASVIVSIVSILLLLISAAAMAADQSEVQRELAAVRRATAEFHDVQSAIGAGYVEVPVGCTPGMGYHFQLDDDRGIAATAADLDTLVPNILVYAPRADGGLRLVAVEYASWAQDAQLFGTGFDAGGNGGPPFATLHAWIWQGNPHGTFAAHNPNVHC